MNSACLFLVYFGVPDVSVALTLKNWSFVDSIDFYVVCDNPDTFKEYLPEDASNITIIPTVQTEYLDRICSLVNYKFPVNETTTGYCLAVGSRPIIADLFPSIVSRYPFWGFVDYDLLIGDVGDYLTVDNMQNYDIFPFKESLHGWINLYRNSDKINKRYLHSITGIVSYYLLNDTFFKYDEHPYHSFIYGIQKENRILKTDRTVGEHYDRLVKPFTAEINRSGIHVEKSSMITLGVDVLYRRIRMANMHEKSKFLDIVKEYDLIFKCSGQCRLTMPLPDVLKEQEIPVYVKNSNGPIV